MLQAKHERDEQNAEEPEPVSLIHPTRRPMSFRITLLAAFAIAMSATSCDPTDESDPAVPDEPKYPQAIVKTERGDITIRLLPDAAPRTVENFIALAKEGYFDNITWHRVVADYVIQTGDPSGTGEGGKTADGRPLYNEINAEALGIDKALVRDFERLDFLRTYYRQYYNADADQFLDRPLKEFYESLGFAYTPGLKTRKALKGAVGMAHAGPGTATSQFFIITHKAKPHLDGTFTFFGEVTAGLDVAQQIQQGDRLISVTIVEE
jgi:cyclophilin family peptidyl-prolyl cis-trans isomerase